MTQCPNADGCVLLRLQTERGEQALEELVHSAQQVRYVHRDTSALVGMIDGLVETTKDKDDVNGTARISLTVLRAIQNIGWRVKDKVAVIAQILIYVDYLTNGTNLWERLDDGE